eukprot:3629133-Pyramimonas_sp.AAC.1
MRCQWGLRRSTSDALSEAWPPWQNARARACATVAHIRVAVCGVDGLELQRRHKNNWFPTLLLREVRNLHSNNVVPSRSFERFVQYCDVWRAFVSDYLQVDLSEAKKMISLIFGVGKPASDIPFAWSLAVDAAQAKDIVLGYGGFQHFRRKFGARRRPAATRLFYASSAREGKVMGVMRQRSGQQNWIVACSTFDELIVSTCALVFRVDEVFGDLQEDCGVKPTVAMASP